LAQNTPDKRLVVNGREMPGAVMQVEGRFYVPVEILPQITSGTLTVETNRIVLTTTTPSAGSAPGAPPPAPVSQGLTREFAREAIADLANMREWKAALATAITFGIQFVGTWPGDYRDRVEDGLLRARVAATSDSDRNAFGLLQNQFANLRGWSDDVISSRQALNAARSVDPNALRNDAVYIKITDCGQFLNSMIVSGVFSDNSSCH